MSNREHVPINGLRKFVHTLVFWSETASTPQATAGRVQLWNMAAHATANKVLPANR